MYLTIIWTIFVQRLNGTIDWQAIPVHTVAIEHENVSDTLIVICEHTHTHQLNMVCGHFVNN